MKTILRIVSVLTGVAGVAALALFAVNVGAFSAIGLPAEATAGFAARMAAVLGLGGLLDLFCAIFGLRAAAHPEKSAAAVVLGVLAVIPGLTGLGFAAALGLGLGQSALGCVMPVLYLVSAIAVRAGAKQ